MTMNAVVYGFPFWIYVDTSNPPKEIVIKSTVGNIRIYPPFRSAPGNFSPFPNIDITKIPGIKYKVEGGGKPHAAPVFVPALGIGSNGLPSTHMVENESYEHLPQDNFPMDSLRIDFLDKEPYRNARNIYIKNLLSILRWRTNQWWINRSIESIAGFYSGKQFEIDSNGRPQGVPATILNGGAEFLLFEKPLSNNLWAESVNMSAQDILVPDYDSLILDAAHYYAIQDLHLAVLNLAAACEQAKNIAYVRLWEKHFPDKPYNRDIVQGNWDLTKHISTKLENKFGLSYKNEYPKEWKVIKDLWDARGNVAHGADCTYGVPPVQVDIIKAKEFFFTTKHCISWLLGLGRRD